MRSSNEPPQTAAERQKSWRTRRKSDGYEMHTIWLDPDVVDSLTKHLKGSDKPQVERTRLINDAVRKMLVE